MNEHVRPPSPPQPAPASAGAVDIAMATADEAGPESPAWRLLEAQRALVREQVALARNERFRNRIKATRDLSIAAAMTLLILGAIWTVWDASRARGVVVEPFSVPPDMAAQGLTGEAAAARMLDFVTELSRPSRGEALAGAGVRDTASSEVRIEIPQAGVSLDEAARWLRRTLGDERPVTGSIRREGDRLLVTVRVAGQPGDVVVAPAAQLDEALRTAAERMFARTEPLRYARYLQQKALREFGTSWRGWLARGEWPSPEALAEAQRNRRAGMESAIGIARRVAEGGGPEQAWGFAFWGAFLHALESSPESIRLLEQARRLDPELAYAAAVLTTVYNIEGEPHLERREALSAERLFRRARGDVNPDHLAWARMQMRSNLARTEGAYGDGVGLYCAAAARGYQIPETYRRCANYRVRNHDAQGARRTWLRMAPDDRPVVEGLILEALIAEARGDGPAEVAAYRRWDLATQLEDREERRSTAVWPGLAVALARGGEQGEAAALAARLPDCYQCLRAKGRVAALGRDWVGAERWLGAAVARAPEIPFAYHDLAEARRARGDLEGARGALRLARKHGPRWADPMKLEGDILAQTGEHRAAIRRYRNAAERAPNWGALHLAWGRSLQALGRDREAAGRYRRATGLDLDAADRAEAVRRLRELGSARA